MSTAAVASYTVHAARVHSDSDSDIRCTYTVHAHVDLHVCTMTLTLAARATHAARLVHVPWNLPYLPA